MAEITEKDIQHLFAMNKFIKWYEETFNKIVDFTMGKKYTRVFTTYEDGKPKTVVCFVDIDGNIYKPASWKTPTKHIRGNINNNNPEQAFYSDGCVIYLK